MATTLANRLSENLASNMVDYARQIWLAGLGAFAKAEQESSKLFETLVKRGEEVEGQLSKAAEDKVEKIRSKAEEARDKANDTWNKLEQVFQKRVARALTRLGVPTRDDVQALARQVEILQQNIEELAKAEEPRALLPSIGTHDIVEATE